MSSKKKKGKGPAFPLATVIFYGPDDRTVTKVAVSVFLSKGAADAGNVTVRRWVGAGILQDAKAAREIADHIRSFRVKTVARSPHVMGCPHEEGEDFPLGGDCPICPFWKGKQGSGATKQTPWEKIRYIPVTYLAGPREILGDDFQDAT
jgi:hypothetical protein